MYICLSHTILARTVYAIKPYVLSSYVHVRHLHGSKHMGKNTDHHTKWHSIDDVAKQSLASLGLAMRS